MATLLWILAVILVIAGIVTALRGQVVLGIVLVVVGLHVGPGGVSIFTRPQARGEPVWQHTSPGDARDWCARSSGT